jgi:hypothetical protein
MTDDSRFKDDARLNENSPKLEVVDNWQTQAMQSLRSDALIAPKPLISDPVAIMKPLPPSAPVVPAPVDFDISTATVMMLDPNKK